MKKYILLFTVSLLATVSTVAQQPPFQANGIKIGAVTQTRAQIWTRLTQTPAWKSAPAETLENWYVPGGEGQVRITWWKGDAIKEKTSTDWQTVKAEDDFIHEFNLTKLTPGQRYALLCEARDAGGEVQSMTVGKFRTAPADTVAQPIRFTVVTGQGYHRRDTKQGHGIYPQMAKLDPDFFVHTGDIIYYDKPKPLADNLDLARLHWQRMFALPHQRAFHNQVASYFIKDDHDTLKNDCWPGQSQGDLTWEMGLKTFNEQLPVFARPYQTIRYGKDLQIWLVEGRDFRSNNNATDGPDKTIWGKEQMAWFKQTVTASDATFRILISPTPVVGPDRGNKNDNHANKGFSYEGDMLRQFISEQKNMFVVCGDRHWQYVSKDEKTGVREYSCGPTSNVHAGGWRDSNRSTMHKYLKVKGGFLAVDIEGDKAIFTHHGVDGSVYNKDVQRAK